LNTLTTNIFEAVLGRKAVKWDAFWHLFEWLVEPREGHGLGTSIRDQLIAFAFGEEHTSCDIRREYPVSGQTDGKGKWADFALGIPNLNDPEYLIIMDDIPFAGSGGKRKLNNLTEYIDLSLQYRPNALVRAIAITDAPLGGRLASVVYQVLQEEANDWTSKKGWKLLPLQTIGAWVKKGIDQSHVAPNDKMKLVLEDFAEWCEGLNQTMVER
jgi:hypothetical protein